MSERAEATRTTQSEEWEERKRTRAHAIRARIDESIRNGFGERSATIDLRGRGEDVIENGRSGSVQQVAGERTSCPPGRATSLRAEIRRRV